jgi:hypothetical protein
VLGHFPAPLCHVLRHERPSGLVAFEWDGENLTTIA